MICETCHGVGFVTHFSPARPCEECGGTGWTHCCEGLRPDNQPQPRIHPAFNHSPAPDCWCRPVEVEPGLWLHADTVH